MKIMKVVAIVSPTKVRAVDGGSRSHVLVTTIQLSVGDSIQVVNGVVVNKIRVKPSKLVYV